MFNGVSREGGMMNSTPDCKRRDNRGADRVAMVECVQGLPGQNAFDTKGQLVAVCLHFTCVKWQIDSSNVEIINRAVFPKNVSGILKEKTSCESGKKKDSQVKKASGGSKPTRGRPAVGIHF